MLNERDALQQAKDLMEVRSFEATKLDRIHNYWRGKQPYPLVPAGVPEEVRRLAAICRLNMMGLVVDVIAQSMSIGGFRKAKASEDAEAWAIWQKNKMDARQAGPIRSTLAYGTAYGVALPGDSAPVMRGCSPRRLTTLYGDDPDWPRFALEVGGPGPTKYRLYDDECVYSLEGEPEGQPTRLIGPPLEHGAGVCPIVRFRNTEDLDEESPGEIEPLMPMQDQLDVTTFGLLVAQHFQAFRQRWAIGWLGTEEEKAKSGASKLWTFEDPDVKVGEFGQYDQGGYLDSRESIVKFMGIVSQTPPHNLLGEMANLAAEALAAAEVGQTRKRGERQKGLGESFEQWLNLAGRIDGIPEDDSAQVRWDDTEARSLAQVVDALGKMAQMLGIPPQELWERIPNVSDQDVERWKATAEKADAIGGLTALLDRQMGTTDQPAGVGLDG